MIAAIGAHNACYSITIPQNAKVNTAIAAIDDDAWAPIEYTRDGDAPAKLRLIIRRSRLLGAQGELWPNWRHHCFVTDREDLDTCAADTYHRAHATVELAIRDLKESAGLSRCPFRRFPANGARLACCVLAHNLIRWTSRLGRAHPARQLTVAATIPTRHQPTTAPHSSPARPKTRQPTHAPDRHQPTQHGGFAGQAVNCGPTVPANDLVRASMFINTSTTGPVFEYGEPLSSPSTAQVRHTRKHPTKDSSSSTNCRWSKVRKSKGVPSTTKR